MSDDGTDPADSTTPPPAPWWSRADSDTWGAPAETPSTAPYGETTAFGTQPYGSAPYGATSHTTPYAGTTPTAPLWGAPAPTGAPAWGYPTDTIGGPAPSPVPKRSGLLAAVGTSLAVALVAGGTAGYVAGRQSDGGSLTDPSASLGTGTSTSSSLNRAPESVAGIAARVLQSVVSISVKSSTGSGTGSGVVIRSDGYILTNNHVVDAPNPTLTVSFNGAENVDVPARIVGRDPDTDLAVIKVLTDKKVVPAALGQSRSLVVGDPVIAIGSPLGLAGTVTTGIISALNRTVNVPGENGARTPLFNAIQTDAAINPGNSGGALVDGKGQVIGINSAIATLGSGGFSGDQSGSIGVGFAIPIDEARSVAEELIRTGTATHPAIGVRALTSTAKGQSGALVQEVLAGAAAAQAGLQSGDLITGIDKMQVQSVDELIVAIRQHKVGQTVTVTYYRDGTKRTAQVTLQDNKGS
ncbi:MAG: putative serine protease PepD [Actinomycetota bacterium]|jgi:putative serine protease PepD|nr:putative serine protease PepD [Actinomycetota bacterium]